MSPDRFGPLLRNSFPTAAQQTGVLAKPYFVEEAGFRAAEVGAIYRSGLGRTCVGKDYLRFPREAATELSVKQILEVKQITESRASTMYHPQCLLNNLQFLRMQENRKM